MRNFSLDGGQKSVSFGTILVYLPTGDFSCLCEVQFFIIILYSATQPDIVQC